MCSWNHTNDSAQPQSIFSPLWGNKVSMLTHIYSHTPQRKIEVTICKITRLAAYFVWPDVGSADLQVYEKYGHT